MKYNQNREGMALGLGLGMLMFYLYNQHQMFTFLGEFLFNLTGSQKGSLIAFAAIGLIIGFIFDYMLPESKFERWLRKWV